MLRSVKNQYQGVNPHLHSLWQEIMAWNRFHNVYITYITQEIKARLRPLGYIVDIEESLQIRRTGDVKRPESDLIIYDTDPHRPQVKPQYAAALQGLSVAELIEIEEDKEHPYFAVIIYKSTPQFQRGEAVAWIELLSPTNKGRSRDAQIYIGKRHTLLASGLVFVEIDFLHETPSTFPRLADYTQQQPHSHPYRIVMLDPRPDLETGATDIQEFDVDMPIPTVTIPLNAGDVLTFDFDAPYQKVYAESFYGDEINYQELPLNFERYSEADKVRILNRMLTVQAAAKQGVDLEQAPFPLTVQVENVQVGLGKLKPADKE